MICHPDDEKYDIASLLICIFGEIHVQSLLYPSRNGTNAN